MAEPRPGRNNRSHLHRHAMHAFADMVAVLRHHDLDMADADVAAALHHLRHVVYRSGLEVPGRERAYVGRNGVELAIQKGTKW